MSVFRRIMRKPYKLLPRSVQKSLRRAGGKILRVMPAPIRKRVRRMLRADSTKARTRTAQRSVAYPADPLHLAYNPKSSNRSDGTKVAGRAAAAVAPDPDASAKLLRAYLGNTTIRRSEAGGRVVGGIFAEDLRHALTDAGHVVAPFTPGVAEALAAQSEVVILDLAGFRGVWSDALDATGYLLFRELLASVESANRRGASVWVVVRGDGRYRLGGLSLINSRSVLCVSPGTPSTEQIHFTENPGDVPGGVVEIIRNLREHR